MTLPELVPLDPNPDGSLRCDTCGHAEPAGKLRPELINTPCPKCGTNMLTQAAHDNARQMLDQIPEINDFVRDHLAMFLEEAGVLDNPDIPDMSTLRAHIHYHGGTIALALAPKETIN